MKKILESYRSQSAGFLTGALLSVSFLPVFLRAIALFLTKQALDSWLLLLIDVLAYTVGWSLLVAALFAADHSRSARPSVKEYSTALYRTFTTAAMGIALTLAAGAVVSGLWTRLEASVPIDSLVIIIAAAVLYGLLFSLAVSYCVLVMIAHYRNRSEPYKPLGKACLAYLLRRPRILLLSTAVIAAVNYGLPILGTYLETVWGLLQKPGFLGQSVLLLLNTLLVWLLYQPLLEHLLRHSDKVMAETPAESPAAEPIDQDTGNTPAKVSRFRLPTGRLAVLVSVVILLALQVFVFSENSPVESVKNDILSSIDAGDTALLEEDISEAADSYETAFARLRAWQWSLGGSSKLLEEALAYRPQDNTVLYLHARSLEGQSAVNRLEPGLLLGDRPVDWYLYLLELYGATENKERQQEMLRLCIIYNFYTQTGVSPADLTNVQKDRLLKELAKLEQELAPKMVVRYFAAALKAGTLTADIVQQALSLAEQYPDNLSLQYYAASFGMNYAADGANHYGRTIEAARRYDALYEEQTAPKATRQEIIEEKLFVASAMSACKEYLQAAVFLAGARKKYDTREMQIEQAYNLRYTGRREESLAIAKELLAADPANIDGLYLGARIELESGNLTSSLEHATKLAKAVESTDTIVYAENLLNEYALVFADKQKNTEYDAQSDTVIYKNLYEAQNKIIMDSPLLRHYLWAESFWLKGEVELGIHHMDRVLAIRKDLPCAVYTKGAMEFQAKRLKEAVETLLHSLELDDSQPVTWFALGHAYDQLEDYPNSLAAFRKVIELIPETDHDIDEWGLSGHSMEMIRSLVPYVTEVK